MGIKRSLRLLLLISLLIGTNSWAAEIHGRSSTQFLWYISDFTDDRQVELGEYLNINVTKIDAAGKFAIYGYGRATQDFTNGEGLNGRLYYLYGDYRDLFQNRLDVQLGRQFVTLAAGNAIVDGLQLNLKNIGPVGFRVFGGRDVIFGVNGEIGHDGDYALGLEAYLSGFRKTDLDFSWFRKWDQGDVSRDLLGLTFKQYLLNNIKLYSNLRYDLTAEVYNEVLAGFKVFPTANLVFTAEYYRSYPTFDTTDIFSVFAVNRYQEAVFRADYTINDRVAVNLGYNRQWYGEDGNANVYQAGVRLRPIDPLLLSLTYDGRTGLGGWMNGGMLDATYDVTKALQVAAGLTVDAYDREIFHEDTGDQIAQKYYLGAKYKLARNMSASLRLDEDVNETRDTNLQGRFIFNYDF